MKHRYDHLLYIAAAGLLFPAWDRRYKLIISRPAGFLNREVHLKSQSNRFNRQEDGMDYFASGSTSFYF